MEVKIEVDSEVKSLEMIITKTEFELILVSMMVVRS